MLKYESPNPSKGSHTKNPQQKEECQSSCTVYTNVQREWIKGKETQRETSPKAANEHGQGAGSIMMQRWSQEVMCDQPYNTIGAVGVSPRGDINQAHI